MVKSAVTDIVSPAVAAEDPLALLGEVVLSCENLANDAVLCRALLKSAYQLLGSSCVCLAVVLSSEILVDECLSVIMSDLACFLQLLLNSLSQSVLSQEHTVTELCVILEQGVSPSRTLAFLVGGVRSGRLRTCPDRGAARSVCDVHSVAEQLSNDLSVRSLAAACACAGEFKQRLLEL